ncbi:hypothetical protein QF028_004415 [Neobacillus sp. B4I6]|uniref:hypothetical protein n=1 Tax=Neobacillus sp. B4I6 TaxID=3373925 RepID=UPI003D1CBF6F
MKKALKITGIVFGGFIALFIIVAIIAINDDGPGTKVPSPKVVESAAKPEVIKEEQPVVEKEEPKNIFKFGEEVPFESGLNVKTINVTKTAERNQFEDPTKYVLVVNIELTNTTGAEMYISSYDFNVQDKDGFQGKPYAGGDQSVSIAPNGKARVNFQFAIDGEGPYKVLGGVATWQ